MLESNYIKFLREYEKYGNVDGNTLISLLKAKFPHLDSARAIKILIDYRKYKGLTDGR